MHPELMFVQDVKVLYNNTLSDESSLVNLKIQVLKNLQTYLQEEDSRMQEADRECEFCDVTVIDHVFISIAHCQLGGNSHRLIRLMLLCI